MAISVQVDQVFQLFAKLGQVINNSERSSTFMSPESMFAEESGRFRIWSGNIGAHKTGRSSLDYRIRENPNLERVVLNLLGDLKRTLEDGKLSNPGYG